MTDTNELRKLLDAATPLPWIVQKDDYWDSWSVTGPAPEHVPGWQTRESEAFDDGSAQGDYRATCTCDTRDLIVAAVNGLPAMLDELDELRAFLADLREAMELLRAYRTAWHTKEEWVPHKHLLDLLREVAGSGVEIECRQYVTVQIDPETWRKIQEVARG